MSEQSEVSLIWNREVPPHWQLVRFGSVANEVRDPNVGGRWHNRLSLSYGRIVPRDIESADGLLPESFNTYNRIVPNDIVLRLTDLQNDKRSLRTALTSEQGIVTGAYVSIRPSSVEPRFLAYYLRAADLAKLFYSMGGGLRQSIGFGDIKTMRLPLPPPDEQQAIADYLDHETAEIDAFIADQERLLDLARERMASSRHQRFSPYGREQCAPLRHITRIENGSGFPVDEQGKVDLELPFFKVGDISKATNGFLKTSDNTVSETIAARLGATVIPRGAIVMAKIGAALFLNRNAILQRPSCIDNNMMGLIPMETVTSRFLQEILLTLDLKALGNPGAVPSLNMDWFKESNVWLPDLETQGRVVAEFSRETEATESLVSDVESARSLAKEHRAALITASVTGQIDVTQRHKPAAEVLEDEVRVMV